MLRDVTYITGTKKTIADVTLYYALHPIMVDSAIYMYSAVFGSIQHLCNFCVLFTERIESTGEGALCSSIEMVRQYSTGGKVETGTGFSLF